MRTPAHAPTRRAGPHGAVGLGTESPAIAGKLPRDHARALAGRAVRSTWLLAIVLMVLGWNLSKAYLVPVAGLDPSWEGALQRSLALHMHYGTQVVFTYGPLGFLNTDSLYLPIAALAAFCWNVLIGIAVFGVLLRSLRDLLPLPAAFVAAYVAGCSVWFLSRDPEVVLALAFAVAIWSITGRYDRYRWTQLAALGLMLGLFPLIKLSLGVGILVLAVIVVAFLPGDRLRSGAVIVSAALMAFAIGWFGTGNGMSNIVPYIRHSIPIVYGYGAAMVLEPSGVSWKPWLALAVIAIVGGLTISNWRQLPHRAAVGSTLCVIVTLWLLAKEAFVRLDGGHDIIFFAFVPIIIVVLRPRNPRVLVTGALAGSVAISYLVLGAVPSLAYRPDQSVRHFGGEVLALSTGGVRHQLESQGRSTMQATYGVPASMIQQMRGRTVDVDPWEQNVTWAYPGSKFDPLPVIQDYSAYTSSLDKLDASYLASSRAPSVILKEGPLAIDGRSPTFEPPMTQVDMECRYRQVLVSPSWQLLKRSADRCGPVRRLVSIETRASGFVHIPTVPPGEAVLATFGIPSPLGVGLESLLARPPEVCMNSRWAGGTWVGGKSFPFRFVVGTSTDLHLLQPSTKLGYSPPFVPLTIDSFSFSYCGSQREMAGVRVTFYEMPMRS